jgi:HK97 family phage major capsid protein
LFIYAEIDASGYWGISDKDVVSALNSVGELDQLDIRINSGGGDVFAGIAIYEAIRRFPAKKTVYVDGLAASAASVIAMAADERLISSAGFVMIHRASGLVYGTDEDMRAMADILADISERIAVVYNERTGQDLDELRNMIQAETWMNADLAVEKGFATGVIQHEGQSNAMSQQHIAARLENARRAFANSMQARVKPAPAPPERAHTPPREPAQQAPVSGAFSLSSPQRKNTPMSMEAQLRERLENATIKAANIYNEAQSEERDLTVQEVATINDLDGECGEIKAQLEAIEKVNARKAYLNTSIPRREGTNETPQGGRVAPIASVPAAPMGSRRKDGGFTNGFTEFALSVRNVFTGGTRDERLFRNAETTFGVGGVGADGGFAIPEEFRREIYSNAVEQDPLISRCFQVPTVARQVTLPTHEAQPWGSESVQQYWTGEGSSMTRSKFAMNQVTIGVNKIAVLAFVTEELLEDAPALEAALSRDASAKINFALSNSVVRGTGVNQPLGFLNAPVLATVLKETSQTADTITVENVTKMYTAMPPGNRRNAVWLVHPDAEHQLYIGAFHRSADPIGFAPGALPNQPFGTLLGRPVVPHEVCETLGDLGDIMFVDLSDYALVAKQGGLRTQTSMHLAFDQDLMAFKFTLRVGGAPLWQGPIDSRDGTFDRSPFVVLQAR